MGSFEMEWIIVLAAALVVLALVARRRRRRGPSPAPDLPYAKSEALFSAAERSFLGALDQAVGDQLRVFGKVRVADVVDVKAKGGRRRSAFNRISAKHFDFVLCHPANLSVVCALELNDRSHQNRGRKQRDEFLAEVCHAAGIPLIQVTAKRAYSVGELRARLMEAMSLALEAHATDELVAPGRTQQRDASASAADATRAEPLSHEPALDLAELPEPACPICGIAMVRRRAAKGPKLGGEFWGCTRYPKCKGVLPIES
jgi:hypothetical protein